MLFVEEPERVDHQESPFAMCGSRARDKGEAGGPKRGMDLIG